jgi:simple sugar transport system substrate-binding protein
MTRALRWLLPALLLGLLAAACGDTTQVRQSDIVVEGPARQQDDRPTSTRPDAAVRIAIVTHGQASSEFWAKVRNGIAAAARQMEVSVSYRSPDVYSLQRMKELVDEAVADRPDGLVVSVPDVELASNIRAAVDTGIPVVTINSGSDLLQRLGVLAHVGQPEFEAGLRAGERLLRGPRVKRAMCINHEVGNVGLDRRCRGFARAMRAEGARVSVVGVDQADVDAAQARLDGVVDELRPQAILALNSQGAMQALDAARAGGVQNVRIGAFDLTPEVLSAVQVGDLRFTIDQQPYLQGYLPVIMLAEFARHGLFPAQGKVIPTGPHFVTPLTAAQAQRLSEVGIR